MIVLYGWIGATLLCLASFHILFWLTGYGGAAWIRFSHIAAAIFLVIFSGWLLVVERVAHGSPGNRPGIWVAYALLFIFSLAPITLPCVTPVAFWGPSIGHLELFLIGHTMFPLLPTEPGPFHPFMIWAIGLILLPVIYVVFLEWRGFCARPLRVVGSFFLFYASLPIAADVARHFRPQTWGAYTAIRSGIVVPFMYAALALMVRFRK